MNAGKIITVNNEVAINLKRWLWFQFILKIVVSSECRCVWMVLEWIMTHRCCLVPASDPRNWQLSQPRLETKPVTVCVTEGGRVGTMCCVKPFTAADCQLCVTLSR